MIAFYAEETQLPAVRQEAVREWVRTVAQSYGKKVGDISYIFCSDEKILAVNREFLQHDYYTDIITFDYTSGEKISGDLFISLDTVRTNAEKFDQPYNEELHRTIIHGILHLCGKNDKAPGARELRGARENNAVASLPAGCGLSGSHRPSDYASIEEA